MLKEARQLTVPGSSTAADRANLTFDFVSAWLFSPAMADLLALFGETMPRAGAADDHEGLSSGDWLHLNEELPEWLVAAVGSAENVGGHLTSGHLEVVRRVITIERRTADDFNFRGGEGGKYRERSQADSAEFSDALRGEILDCTRRLGLVDAETPRHDCYDMTLVLGGGFKSPQLRSQLAAELESKGTGLGRLYFLGSPRFLITDPPEADEVKYYAEHARDEFDLMGAGALRAFDLRVCEPTFLCGCKSADLLCPRWLQSHESDRETPTEYTHERMAALTDVAGKERGFVLSASTHRPPYRPDTSDTFALWARVADPQAGQRALVVTTQVFVPFQTFDGVKRLYLGHGVEVDAVGFGADWGDRPLTAEYLLQETLSAIRSARRLLVEACDMLRKSD